MKALVIGAGIAGLSMAIGLRRAGIDVLVCERAPALGEVGAGISLWANAIRSLERLGAADPVRDAAQPVIAAEFRTADGRTLLRLENQNIERERGLPVTLWMIHRADLVEALSSQIDDDCKRFGRTLVSVKQSDRAVEAHFGDGTLEHADILIGADGLQSAVRATVFDRSAPRYSGYTCWRGICELPSTIWKRGHVSEIWGRGRRVGITTLPGGRVYWWATDNRPQGQIEADSSAFLRQAFGDWAAPVPAMIEATPVSQIFQHDIFDRPPLKTWHDQRVVLIGDAAHPTTPNFGQGGCVSIEDAAVLSRCLMAKSSHEEAFGKYQAERSARTTRLTAESRRLGTVGQWENRLACAIRDKIMGWVPVETSFKNMLRMATYDPGSIPERT